MDTYARLEFIPYPLLAGLALLAILMAHLWQRRRTPAHLLCFSVFWLYLLLVTSLTVFPVPLPMRLEERQNIGLVLSRVNLVPFSFGGLFDASPRVIFDNLAGNILLTLPFGFGINFIARLPVRRIPWLALAVGMVLETTQLAVSLLIGGAYRGVDINDVLLNACGVLLGYGLFQGFARLYRTAAGVLQRNC